MTFHSANAATVTPVTGSLYATMTEFNGEMAMSDPSTFDDAVDVFAKHMEEGHAAVVFRIELGATKAAVDVTEDAVKRVFARLRQRNQEAPEWLLEAV